MRGAQRVIKYLAIAFAVMIMGLILSSLVGAGMLVSYIMGGVTGERQGNAGELVALVDVEQDKVPQALEIEVGLANVTLRTADEFGIETTSEHISGEWANEKLTIREDGEFWNWQDAWRGDLKEDVVVNLPKKALDSIKIKMGAGVLDAERLTAEVIKLELGAGKSKIDELIAVQEAEIDSGAGLLEIFGGKLHDLDLDMGVGRVVLKSELTGRSKVKAGVGELNLELLGKAGQYSLVVEHGIGAINLNGQRLEGDHWGSGDNSIKVDGGVGAVNINVNGDAVEQES